MRAVVTTIRIITGALFIFSGLVKAIDPRGLAYKMQEFFEAWASDGFFKDIMVWMHDYALGFSIFMITLEVAIGVALLVGWKRTFTTIVLLLLILFFTFLTSYVLFSGKIRACGCFGDCIPLTPVQTFTKDIILLVFAGILLIKRRLINPIAKPAFLFLYVIISAILTLILQSYVLNHLPVVDCLPYKKGNNILELRKMPANAVMDQYDYLFIYEKDGVKQEFPASALPDSSWKFVDRRQKLVKKGSNNIPLINDFSLSDSDGNDVTETILNNSATYFLLFLKEIDNNTSEWVNDFAGLSRSIAAGGKKLYVVTPQRKAVETFLNQHHINVDGILTSDATAIKTAARSNPALFRMEGPVVRGKWGWADLDKVNTQ